MKPLLLIPFLVVCFYSPFLFFEEVDKSGHTHYQNSTKLVLLAPSGPVFALFSYCQKKILKMLIFSYVHFFIVWLSGFFLCVGAVKRPLPLYPLSFFLSALARRNQRPASFKNLPI